MKLKTIALLAIVAFTWLGCGVDEEPIRPRVVTKSEPGPNLAKMSVPERKQATEYQDELGPQYFKWPAGQAGERDAVADTRDCREQAVLRDDYARANGVIQFAIITECMNAKGWVVNQAAVEARAAAGK